MKKLIALYKAPADADAFFDHYRAVHLPLVAKLPGLIRAELTKINRTLLGDKGNFLLAEMYFEDAESFDAAMTSAENKAVGQDAVAFAGAILTVMTGEILEF